MVITTHQCSFLLASCPTIASYVSHDARAMIERPRRCCLGCLRHTLVYDFTQVSCKGCSMSGTACPRYGETKLLTTKWLEPGKVRYSKCNLKHSHRNDGIGTAMTGRPSSIDDMHVVIPPVQANTDVNAMIEAMGYCKWAYGNTLDVYSNLVDVNRCIFPCLLEILETSPLHACLQNNTCTYFRKASLVQNIRVLALRAQRLSHGWIKDAQNSDRHRVGTGIFD